MRLIMSATNTHRWWIHLLRASLIAVALLIVSGKADVIAQQVLDICGCANTPGLTAFDARDPATYPPGTTGCSGPCTSGSITFALPPDGILRFSSFTAIGGFHFGFARNSANTPVTILVAGDANFTSTVGCCMTIGLNGAGGSNGTGSGVAGVGGLGGNGGYRGGDGSALGVNGFDIGGAGFGPAGGPPGSQAVGSGGGVYLGIPEMLPLVGGSGGGGGGGFQTSASCTGGGGGGGGGGLLIAANGTLTLTNYQILAEGGTGGGVGNSTCARGGGGGAGGSIRLVAASFAGGGTQQPLARGGGGGHNSFGGTDGRIRFETLDTTAQTAFAPIPSAIRVTGPGPISNPVSPTVAITQVNGNPVPEDPQGHRGSIDIILPAPGVTGVDVATTGVPSGTTVQVTVKARMGAAPVVANIPLTSCDAQGNCTGSTTFNLIAGAYVIEARATFQVP
jgi:hypothetical protein